MSVGDVRRGDVFLCEGFVHGGRLTKTRPVVVVQNNMGNRFSPETIVAAVRDLHGGKMLPIFDGDQTLVVAGTTRREFQKNRERVVELAKRVGKMLRQESMAVLAFPTSERMLVSPRQGKR